MKKGNSKGKKAKERKVRLFLRLNAEANERLRALTRYHGDLSRYIDEALRSADLRTLVVEEMRTARDVPGLTAVVSRDANAALRDAARERGCSITALANRAVESWLGKRDG
jgi:hypothetical protein